MNFRILYYGFLGVGEVILIYRFEVQNLVMVFKEKKKEGVKLEGKDNVGNLRQ